MSARLLRAIAALGFWICVVASASAQSTGSSFGGGSWEGSSGSSSGGSSGSSGYSSSGYGSGVSYDDSNAYVPSFGVQCLVSVLFLLFLYVLIRYRAAALDWLARDRRPIDVAMVQLAIDARSRRFVQDALRTLGARGDTVTSVGRAELLAATVAALRKAELAWIFAGAKSLPPMPPAQAQSEFKRLADDARAGYQTELLRAADGKTQQSAEPVLAPKEHEGQGAVLVTVLAASRRTLLDVRADHVEDIHALLAQLASIPAAELVAMEVVWTPSAENDRMSSDELVQKYPTLTRLPGAVGGRMFCTFCGGPHAAELTACPHCGAPVAG